MNVGTVLIAAVCIGSLCLGNPMPLIGFFIGWGLYELSWRMKD